MVLDESVMSMSMSVIECYGYECYEYECYDMSMSYEYECYRVL